MDPTARHLAYGRRSEKQRIAERMQAHDMRRLSGSHSCAILGKRPIILAVQEVLSKSDDPKAHLSGQEFYELSLLDVANDLGTRYCVRQAHAEWSEIDGQIMWDKEETDHFWILAEAKRRYAERKLTLAEKGFIYSDMDLF